MFIPHAAEPDDVPPAEYPLLCPDCNGVLF